LYGQDWSQNPKFVNVIPNRHKETLRETIANEASKRGHSLTIDHVVAGLPFGFWQNMMGSALSHVLWKYGVGGPFPHLPSGLKRTDVYERLERPRKFRNAVMHHYAIFDQKPLDEFENIKDLLSWMCPQTLWLMKELSNPSVVMQNRPRI
jgi:hypothetical protein